MTRGGSGPYDDRPATVPGYFASLRYLGQLDLTYLVCEAAGELVLVDQHAAHERVELARLIARAVDHDVATQAMLFPVTIEATPAQLALVERAGELLARVGFHTEPAGTRIASRTPSRPEDSPILASSGPAIDRPSSGPLIAIRSAPAGLRHGDPAQLLRRLLDEWVEDGAPSETERVTRVLAEIACHSVVRAGDRLTPGEAEALLRALDAVDVTTPAPHGRTLVLRLPLAEIGRRFGR